jgi:hypothetical protein
LPNPAIFVINGIDFLGACWHNVGSRMKKAGLARNRSSLYLERK